MSKLAQLANDFCRRHGLEDRFVAHGSVLHWIAEGGPWSVVVDPEHFEQILEGEEPLDIDSAAIVLCLAIGTPP